MSTSTATPRPPMKRPSTKRPSVATRRAGYAIAVVVNVALLWAVNVWPGWEAMPFLTDETPQILGLVNAAFVLAIVLNLLYLVRDPLWLTTVGTLATTALGTAVTARALAVFPFDLSGAWTTVVRVLLVVGLAGTAIAFVVALVSLVRLLAGR
ncbi:MAG: hypothetical protein ACXV3S_08555 [Kineosporiaceae bacterium]